MTQGKSFTWLAAAIFAAIAIIHIIRLFTHFQIIVGTHVIPQWCSYVGIVVAAFLSWMLCREARGTTGP
jgi:protein-S-isoprenylcysteine O-methyltransferase Ste14